MIMSYHSLGSTCVGRTVLNLDQEIELLVSQLKDFKSLV